MDDNYFKKVATTLILAVLIVLSFFLVKSLLLSIIAGFVLAFIFSPFYNLLHKRIKSKNLSVTIICALLLAAIILPIWFFSPYLIDESIKLYRASQTLDIVTPLKTLFPSLFASDEFSQEIGSTIQSFITKLTNSLMNYLSQIILDFATILLQLFVVLFTFFYVLRDKDKLLEYIKSLLPFSKEVEKRLFDSTKDITFSVLYGQILIGIIQGIILGIGLFIFGVSNALLLTIVAIIAGILPIVGPMVVGVPVAMFLLIQGNSVSAIGILIFASVSSLSDHFFRPLFVSKRTQLHSALVLIGMVGGFLFVGLLGFIIGPLILAYLVIIIETYRNKPVPAVLIKEPEKNK